MATWTEIPNSSIETGKAIRAVDGLAFRDNPVAIAEGATGAPRIVNEAIEDATLGAEKFQSGTDERDWIISRVSSNINVVGSYAMLYCSYSNFPALTIGGSCPSAYLWYAKADGSYASSPRPSGTWRLMGDVPDGTAGGRTTLWLRVA